MFVDLQIGGPIKSSLLQAIIEFTYDAKIKDYFCGSFTVNMVCAETPTVNKDPCDVIGLEY